MIVVRHSYIGRRGSGGRVKAIGKALAHVKYIEHRPGRDRDEGDRELFSDSEDRVRGAEIRQEIREIGNQRVVVHKLTLAPEINPEDKKAFTREVMDQLGQAKGLDLHWYAVAHDNTDHHHVHVVVMGKDRNGTDVRLDLKDIDRVKEYGDRFLEREHPRELERAREERERKKEARRREWERTREQRQREGLELPWMHKQIVREQLEPYETWREKQDQREYERERARKEKELEKIEAAGKEWSRANTLEELRGLNERLWDNYDERIGKEDYKKLGGWIKEKEREVERRLVEKELEKEQKSKERQDSFEYAGKQFNKKDPYKKLMKLAQKLREKDEKLPYDDYQKLRGWIEDRDRNRWAGALEKGLADAKREMVTPERPRTTETAGGRVIDPMQEHLMRNPVVGLFMIQAGLASELVRSIELTENRDRLKEGRDEIEKARGDVDDKLAKPREPELEDLFPPPDEKLKEHRDKLDKGLSETKEAERRRAEQRRKDQEERERKDRDRDNFERGGWW